MFACNQPDLDPKVVIIIILVWVSWRFLWLYSTVPQSLYFNWINPIFAKYRTVYFNRINPVLDCERFVNREKGQKWVVPDFGTYVNGESRNIIDRGALLDWFLRPSCCTRDFCPALAALVGRIQNPVFTSLHLRSLVHVVPTLPSRKPQSLAGKTQPLASSGHVFRHYSSSHTC